MEDTIACAVCQKRMRTINNKHLASHGLTADAYRAQYPGHPLLSPAAQAKLSARSVASNASRKGKPRSEADLAAIRAGVERRPSRKGIKRGPMSEDTKLKLSDAHKAAFASGRVHPNQGKPLPQDVRDKISASLSGRVVGPAVAMRAIETKRARGFDFAFFRGRSHSPESRAEIGRKSRARFEQERPDRRAPMLERISEAKLVLLNDVAAPVFNLRCEPCGHEFTRTPQVFQPSKFDTRVCDQCFPQSRVSIAEDEIAAFVADLCPGERVIRSDWTILSPLELDIVLPSRNIAVEYCGLYWHSELAGKHKWYHRHKLDACRTQGIRLITIFEDEWLEKRPIVEAMLRNLLGANTVRLNARSLRVERIDAHQANAVLRDAHIGGRGRAQAHYGLIEPDGRVVSVMTFSSGEISRRRAGWEINRFASLPGMTVRGAASRLFAAFVRDHAPQEVISYADLRWGTGAVYQNLGFVCEGLTIPNYWYFRPNEMRRYHRYGLRKNADDPPGMTEWQARQDQGWNRIHDCGHARWVWKAGEA